MLLFNVFGMIKVPPAAIFPEFPEFPPVTFVVLFLVQAKLIEASVIFPFTLIPALVPLQKVEFKTLAVATGLGLIETLTICGVMLQMNEPLGGPG